MELKKQGAVKQPKTTRGKAILTALVLTLAITWAIYLRVSVPWPTVFKSDSVRYTTVDAYFHMRLVDNLMVNYPHLISYDPYLNYPGSTSLAGVKPAWPFVIATPALALDKTAQALGTTLPYPAQDIVGAFMPVLLGLLALIPIFYTARLIFNKTVGYLAIAIAAVLPGEYLSRTILGSTDYHALEILFMATTALWAFALLKARTLKARLGYGALFLATGLAYYYTWEGAPLLLFIAAGVGFVYTLYHYPRTRLPIAILSLIPLALTVYYITSIDSFRTALPGPLVDLWARGYDMFAWHTNTATSEEMSLLFRYSNLTLAAPWTYFGFTFYIALIATGLLAYRVHRYRRALDITLLVWSLVTLAMTLSMRRFAYYYFINIALLNAFFFYATAQTIKNKGAYSWFTGLFIAVLITVPCARAGLDVAGQSYATLTDDWYAACKWLKTKTPDPFIREGGHIAYDTNYDNARPYNKAGLTPTYTVLSWWDYGYWLLREAERVPIAHPGGGMRQSAAWFLAAQSEEEASHNYQYLDIKTEDYTRARYVVVDVQTVTTKFYAIPQHVYQNMTEYMETTGITYRKTPGAAGTELKPYMLFYPAYYYSMAVRLFNFDGRAYQAPGTVVAEIEDKPTYREIINIYDAPNFTAAQAFINGQTGSGRTYRLGGTDPFVSPVDLGALKNYKVAYIAPGGTVKIFENLAYREP